LINVVALADPDFSLKLQPSVHALLKRLLIFAWSTSGLLMRLARHRQSACYCCTTCRPSSPACQYLIPCFRKSTTYLSVKPSTGVGFSLSRKASSLHAFKVMSVPASCFTAELAFTCGTSLIQLDTVLLSPQSSLERLRPTASIVKAENMSHACACTLLRGNTGRQLFAFGPHSSA
jgi:hypothetical protein